ncbi:MFS transporter, partial [Amycolatopsis keratiniphila subsp. nogabecina]
AWLVTYPIAGWVATDAGFTTAWTVLAGLAAIGAITALAVWPRIGKAEVGGRAAVATPEAAKAAEGTLVAGQCACVRTV